MNKPERRLAGCYWAFDSLLEVASDPEAPRFLMRALLNGGTLGEREMQHYDPAVSPNAELWLSLDEDERIGLIRAFHQRRRIKVPNMEAHAATHAIVENQLAEALPSAVNALQRLLAGGLDRHDAVHAIGCVLMEHLWNLQNRPKPEGDPHQAYFAALDAFTVESWRKLASG